MADNIWSSSASTDYNTAGNWSLGHVPDETETAVFNNTSVVNCTASGAIVALAITVASNYTGAWNSGSQTITTSGTIQFDGTGTLTLSNSTITITGNGTFHIGSGVGTCTVTGCNFDLKGNNSVDVDKSSVSYFGNVTGMYAGKTTTFTGAGNYFFFAGILTFAGNGTLTLNQSLYQSSSTTCTPIVTSSGYTINGNSKYFYITGYVSGSITLTLPALTFGTGVYPIFMSVSVGTMSSNTTVTFEMSGDIAVNGSTMNLQIAAASYTSYTANTIFNTNNYAISVNTTFYLSTTGASKSNITVNFGSSTVSTTNMTYIDTQGVTTLNFQSSQWTISGNTFIILSAYVVDAGTSKFTFTGTGTITFTPSGKTYYDIAINKTSSGGFTLGGNLISNSLDSDTVSGTFNSGGYTITTTGNISFDSSSSGALTLSNSVITINGNGTLHIGSGIGTTTLTNTTIELKGTDSFDIDKSSLTFPSVKFNGDGLIQQSIGSADWTASRLYMEPGTTIKYAAGRTVTISSYTAGDWDGTAAKPIVLRSTVDDSYFYFTNPSGMTVKDVDVMDSNASNLITASSSFNQGHNNNWFFIGDVSSKLMNHWRLDEYSGTTANDTTENADHGTLTNMDGDEWAFGIINRGLRFAASSEYINVPYTSTWNDSDDLTVSLWAKFYSFPTNLYNINSLVGRWNDSVSTSDVWGLGIVNRYIQFDCSYDGNWQSESLTTTEQLQTGQWYHIVVVHDSVNKTNTIYVNDAQKTTRGLANGGLYNHGSKTVEIGSMIYGGYRNYADAIIDDVRLYNRVLTVGDINALYELKSYKSFQYLTVVLSNCTYNGNVFDDVVEDIEALIQTEFVKISNLEMRGVGCSMVRGDTDSLTIGIAAGFYTASKKAKLDSTEALNLRAAINSAITSVSSLVVSEVRVESTLIQDPI